MSRYFGNPVASYSPRDGIEDGFLAPYRVHRVVTDVDAIGWRPSLDEVDRYGREIPDELYQTRDFERSVVLKARTQAIAKHLTDFMRRTDRWAKTIVFCVDQEQAAAMRQALTNLNQDLVARDPAARGLWPPPAVSSIPCSISTSGHAHRRTGFDHDSDCRVEQAKRFHQSALRWIRFA